jgi:dsDNA-specific endonuclease/ATPase MutS2
MSDEDEIGEGEIPEIVIPIEDAFDLHPFPPRDIPEVVEEYLRAAMAKWFTEVRLIHGRGRGVQRARVQALLARLSFVRRAYDAPPGRGGWGATVVELDLGRGNADT